MSREDGNGEAITALEVHVLFDEMQVKFGMSEIAIFRAVGIEGIPGPL